MKLAIIMPAYNEASVISEVIRRIPLVISGVLEREIIVVDDNSSDKTAQVAKWAGATVLRHHLNLGAGGATMTGLEYARRRDFDIAVTLDSDGQHDPANIEDLIQKIIEGYDFVIGSRLKGKVTGDMPYHKLFGNKFLNLITFMFYGTWVSDSQSGFKAFSRQAMEKCRISNVGYEFCSEMIGQARRAKLKICEVPVRTIYTSYSKRKGQHFLNGFNIIIRLTLSKLRGNS